MNSGFDDPDSVWRECERAWATWLNQNGYTVQFLSGAVGNAKTTLAPLTSTPGPAVRTPDLASVRAGLTEYWEVKFRSEADVDRTTGVHHYWIGKAAFNDYRRLARSAQVDVHVVLFEAGTGTYPDGRWLRASLRELRDAGRNEQRFARDGSEIDAWVWPVSAMRVVPGPPVRTGHVKIPILVDEGDGEWLDDDALEEAERRRRWPESESATGAKTSDSGHTEARALRMIDADNQTALSAASSLLRLSPVPRYSVTRVGPLRAADDVLNLLHYGIRVFVVTDKPLVTRIPAEQLDAFRGSRLLEDVVVDELQSDVLWAVDGRLTVGDEDLFDEAMKRADAASGLNYGQWLIVHARSDANVLVSAGAGTGKTETMAERMVFLLATQQPVAPGLTSMILAELTPEEFAFVTFTREAALEMRARLGRSLMLRQRMCRYCVPPVVAWMMQLSNARVSTIHSFAKDLIQQVGSGVGYGPNFAVGQLTLRFRHLLQNSLSAGLEALDTRASSLGLRAGRKVPAAYAWEDHLEAVWAGLERNGLSLTRLDEKPPPDFRWGRPRAGDFGADVFEITRSSLEPVAKVFSDLCRDEHVVPTSQLIPLALSAVTASSGDDIKPLRYLFVDEFQDTDAVQISLFLELSQRTGARVFAVGDIKQGIYRFRGAAGNAFAELAEDVGDRGMDEFVPLTLNRNFRAGHELLESLHPYFQSWGANGWLTYGEDAKLRPREVLASGTSTAVSFTAVPSWWRAEHAASAAARHVLSWRASHPNDSLAILCRVNWQARQVQKEIGDLGGHCTVYVGGEFFRTPAVAETRVLLDAILVPSNLSALLELCETRWGAGIMGAPPPHLLSEPDAEAWRRAESKPTDWTTRLGKLGTNSRIRTSDLESVVTRVSILRRMLTRTSVVGLLVDCVSWFLPDAVARPAEESTERARYSKCLNHLITLISNNFDEGTASPTKVLKWMRLQIATNQTDNEPFEQSELTAEGATVALTVHKAKGLAYDRVIVPFTTKPFVRSTPAQGRTDVAVLQRPGELPSLVWEWCPPGQSQVFANYDLGGLDDAENLREAVMEETRLLYVAMTRAREELHMFRRLSTGPIAEPKDWSELLGMPGAH